MRNLCGTDIIEIERIKKIINSLENTFINKIYTENEIKYCEEKNNAKYQHYAARFAAKEAVFKAVSQILDTKYSITWKNIEVINDENGKPKINFIDSKIEKLKNIDISISHCRDYAIAFVIAEIED